MVTTKQKSRADSQNIKKGGGWAEYTTMEYHQFAKLYRNIGKKNQWRLEATRKETLRGQ